MGQTENKQKFKKLKLFYIYWQSIVAVQKGPSIFLNKYLFKQNQAGVNS